GGGKGNGKYFIKDLNIRNTQLGGSVYFTGTYRYFVALRFEATFGQVKASDNVLKNISSSSPKRYERNLSFKSSIDEIMLVAEIHPLFFKHFEKDQKLPRLSPYLLGGVGFFQFNPKAKVHGDWVELQPLSTEGEGFSEYPGRKPYKLKQLNVPFGGGIKYKISPIFSAGVECVYRLLSTDYLDDVSTNYIDKEVFSNHFQDNKLTDALLLHDRKYEIDPSLMAAANEQRGNPNKKDSYFTINFKLGFLL
ncbi:MAG: hypothetical protein ABIO81_13395, partial [Ginsengibacter sp.]